MRDVGRWQLLLETTGRITGAPRRTPIGGYLGGDAFWFVSMHGESSNYVRNIKANNIVRIRIHERWRTGRAELVPDDDAHAHSVHLSRMNRTANRALGTDLLTMRIDLDE